VVNAKLLFALTQIAILALIFGTVLIYWAKKNKQNRSGFAVTEAELWSKKQTNVPSSGLKTEPLSRDSATKETAKIGTAIPTWPPGTSPYKILGIGAEASRETVEKAYKLLLSNYHPDRFASWGGDYHKKANDYILLLQWARDEILKTRK
jgi:hypothetical protein